jgi:hypothetical protein
MTKVLEVFRGRWEQKYFSEKQKKDSTQLESTALNPLSDFQNGAALAAGASHPAFCGGGSGPGQVRRPGCPPFSSG